MRPILMCRVIARHVFLGLFCYFGAMVAACAGIAEKTGFGGAYALAPGEVRFRCLSGGEGVACLVWGGVLAPSCVMRAWSGGSVWLRCCCQHAVGRRPQPTTDRPRHPLGRRGHAARAPRCAIRYRGRRRSLPSRKVDYNPASHYGDIGAGYRAAFWLALCIIGTGLFATFAAMDLRVGDWKKK